MRIIDVELITKTVAELCVEANIKLGADINEALKKARENEISPLACSALDNIIKNADIAESEKLPICQDTGLVVVFIKIGADVHVNGDINESVNEGVRRGYRDGYCRNSIVCDPINRINTGDNTPAVIYYDFIPGDCVEITVMPKGFGSENMGAVRMLNPSDGIDVIENFVIETVRSAGANPCPPVIIGVGIGGTMDKSALLAKQALLRDVGSVHPDPFWADVEKRLFIRINELGIGASGYGGSTTALAVFILTYPTHIAGLPVAINIGCHATRHKTRMI